MPIQLNPARHLLEFLKEEKFQQEIRDLHKQGYLPNEATLQAYIWNHLQRCLSREISSEVVTYYQDYTIFIEAKTSEAKKKEFPDMSLRRKDTPDQQVHTIELKHHAGKTDIGRAEWKKIYEDIDKLNNRDTPGIFLMTCPLSVSKDQLYSQINERCDSNTEVIIVQCR